MVCNYKLIKKAKDTNDLYESSCGYRLNRFFKVWKGFYFTIDDLKEYDKCPYCGKDMVIIEGLVCKD